MTARFYLLLCLLLCVVGCHAPHGRAHVEEDAGAPPLFGGGGPASLPINFLVKPDTGTQQIVCSADGGCVYVECDAGEVFMRVDGSTSRCVALTSGGAFPIVPGQIFYRPGSTTAGNVCATEGCVAADLTAAPGPQVVGDCSIANLTQSTTQWNFGGSGSLTTTGDTCTFTVSGSGQLQNLLQLSGVELINNKTSGSVMSLELPGNPVVTLSSGTTIQTGASASAPVWSLASGSMTIVLQGGSGFATNNSSQAIVALSGNATLNLYLFQVAGPINAIISSIVSGTSGTTLNVYGDTTAFPWVTQTLFSGTQHLHRLDQIQGLAGCDGGGVPTAGDGGVAPFYCAYGGGGAPTCIGPPSYCFADASPEPVAVGEVLQIVHAGPQIKFAPLNITTANSIQGCDAGLVPTGNDGGVGFHCGSGGSGGVTSVTGTAPIVSSGGTTPAISITGATTSAVGSIKLANDLAGTSTSPEVVYLANQSSIADTSGDLALGTTTIPADSQTKSLFLANGTAPSTASAAGTWLTGVDDGLVHHGYHLTVTEDGYTTTIGSYGGSSAVLAQGIVFGNNAAAGINTVLGQTASTTLTTGNNLLIYGQTTSASSSTGGGVQVYPGNGTSASGLVCLGGNNTSFCGGSSLSVTTTTGGTAGGVAVNGSATPLTVTDSSTLTTTITGSSITNTRFYVEPLVGSTSTDTALYLGTSSLTPSSANYALEANATYTQVNGATTLYLNTANVTVAEATSATTAYEFATANGVNVGIGSLTAAGNGGGTNVFVLSSGTNPSTCGGILCEYASSSAGYLTTGSTAGGASSSGISYGYVITTPAANVATSGTANGVTSGLFSVTIGNGAAGLGGTSNGGNAGSIGLNGGTGGAAVSTGTGGSGTSISLFGGAGGAPAGAGTGGSGGNILLESGYSSAGGGTAGANGIVEAVSNSVGGAATYVTQLDYSLVGTVNSQANKSLRKVCNARVNSAATTTCTLGQVASEGIAFNTYCVGRTTTAGSSGNVGDTTVALSAGTAPGVCSTVSGGTTTCVGGAGATLESTGTGNITSCALSSVSNVPTWTLTASTNTGMVVDVSIVIQGTYN